MMERRTYTVKDRERTLEFDGVLLSHASSRWGTKPRWMEVSIYRTNTGRYVVAGAGKSAVPGESERPWAHVSDHATGVVDSLYLEDDGGVRYLTRVAQRALADAAEVDDDIRSAFLHENVT